MKQKHIEKYSDPSAITDDADDRTETFRENVREILLTNPKLVETEWKHHKVCNLISSSFFVRNRCVSPIEEKKKNKERYKNLMAENLFIHVYFYFYK